ncbi:hypothetical protein [Sphingorhabdus sp.]|jgi:hypothetical protein|uniref:hypothetical protein n=1 Tax=Sphingorhabdus sp. TaxID=1902408 RepID=UPI0037CC9E89
MRSILPNGQTAALAMAMAGAALVAVTTMLVPVSLLEGVARLSGLSDLIPAAGAPLGDAARAFVAFATGAMTLAVLSYLLLRGEGTLVRPTANDVGMCDAAAQQDGDMAETLRAHMPWNEGVDDIRELGDLPTLRIGDVHPDAPARRLLVASQDLPPLELSEEYLFEPQPPQEAEQHVEAAPEYADGQPGIAEMVGQLEAAVALRRQKLAELEAVAADLSADAAYGDEPGPAISEGVAPAVTKHHAAVAEFHPMRGPVLEAVPREAVQDDDLDSALAAALASLHRIHAGGR